MRVSECSERLQASGTVVQTDFDVTVGQCIVSDRNPACAVLIRHETLFRSTVKSHSLCSQANCMFCATVVREYLIDAEFTCSAWLPVHCAVTWWKKTATKKHTWPHGKVGFLPSKRSLEGSLDRFLPTLTSPSTSFVHSVTDSCNLAVLCPNALLLMLYGQPFQITPK